MQISALLLALLPVFGAAGFECVTSGTTSEVTASKNCCHWWDGKFCGTNQRQGICVIPDNNLNGYKQCTDIWGNPTPDDDCIPGDGTGLSSCTEIHPTSTTSLVQAITTS
jgi:hypothetical protein